MQMVSKQVQIRLDQMLHSAFGEVIAEALRDGDVTEILVNPDGQLWIETAAQGRVKSGVMIAPSESERIIRLVASSVAADLDEASPLISAELPGTGERFQGILPPIALYRPGT